MNLQTSGKDVTVKEFLLMTGVSILGFGTTLLGLMLLIAPLCEKNFLRLVFDIAIGSFYVGNFVAFVSLFVKK